MKPRETLLVACAALALTAVLTWPIAARFSTAGRLDSGDGRFSVWNVAWVAHALTTNPGQLFDANIFYPNESTLAYSEANLVAGAIAVPVWLLTKNPVAATNFAILCSFVLSFVTMFALVRRLSGSKAAAAAAAIWFAFCPFVFSHIPHIQLLMTFGLPLILLRLHAFVDHPSWPNSLWLGGAMALQALACGYYGIAGGLIAGFGVVWFAFFTRRWRDWRYWAYAAFAAVIAAALVAPFFAPYTDIRGEGFTRTIEDARLHSVRWRSYFASPRLFDQWLLPLIGTWREVLFPGVLPIVLSLFVVVRAAARRRPLVSTSRGILGFYGAIGAIGFWIALGPDGGLYTALYDTVPFFDLIRAPNRFGLLVTLMTAVIGGIGFATVARLTPIRVRPLVIVAGLAVMCVRSTVGGLRLVDAPPLPLANQRLMNLPRGVVAAFPYWTGPERHRHTEYMWRSALDWKPLVNGYSDHFPADIREDKEKLAHFPELDAWQPLRDRQTRYVLMHWYLYPPEERPAVESRVRELLNYLRLVVDDPEVSLFEIVSWPEGTN